MEGHKHAIAGAEARTSLPACASTADAGAGVKSGKSGRARALTALPALTAASGSGCAEAAGAMTREKGSSAARTSRRRASVWPRSTISPSTYLRGREQRSRLSFPGLC